MALRGAADRSGEARVLFDLGWIAIDQARWADAVRLNAESLALARAVDDPCAVYRALTNLGWARLCCGEGEAAAALFAEAYALATRIGHIRGIAVSLANLAWIALGCGELARSTALAQESLRLCYLLGEREVLAECLEILAAAAAAAGDVQRGQLLRDGAEALWQALHVVRPPTHFLVGGADPDGALAGPAVEADHVPGSRPDGDMVVALALGCRRAPGGVAPGG